VSLRDASLCGVVPLRLRSARRWEEGGRRPGVWGKVAVRPSSSFSRAALRFFRAGGGIKSEILVAQFHHLSHALLGVSHGHLSTPIRVTRGGPLPLQRMNVARSASVRAASFHFAAPTFRRTRMTVDGRSGSRPLLDGAKLKNQKSLWLISTI
jgi:hypothetical protein